MRKRTMVKIKRTEQWLHFSTINRKRKSPTYFLIPRGKILSMDSNKVLLLRDGAHIAELRLNSTTGLLEITFCWLNDSTAEKVDGWRQRVFLPYSELAQFDSDDVRRNGSDTLKILSQDTLATPKFTFKCDKNLTAVIAVPVLRHKLSHFLSRNFHWPYSSEIILYNDFEPFSFTFQEITRSGREGLFGGIILHGADEGFAKARYSIHT